MMFIRSTLRRFLLERANRRATHTALSRLDERSLEDIGFNRADVDMRFG
jgi:uncharacterized protein YjiS (DUF1127 family)